MSNTSEQSLAFDQGYEGTFDENGQPHGKGRMKFKDDDDFDRNVYEGEWIHGQMSGQGQMSFVSGDIYEGVFNNGVPHGPGRFTYVSGDVSSCFYERVILFSIYLHYILVSVRWKLQISRMG